jgi:hypothetical protein
MLHYLIIGPLEVIVVFIILWYRINWSALAGMSLLLLLLPVQGCFGRIFARLRYVVSKLFNWISISLSILLSLELFLIFTQIH